MQKEIDEKNIEFWNELCGSGFAKSLGITDHSSESLSKFDEAYLAFYPYLLKRVPVHLMKGKKVLEIGLGYGTLGFKIAESGAQYIGLDIAKKPVDMMNFRLQFYRLHGEAIQGSILDCPLENQSVDCVVSIGCFHHTGNLRRAVNETFRVLRPGGKAYLMVYNQFSYRQWSHWPKETFRALWESSKPGTRAQRSAYDTNSNGAAAPETQFFSIRDLKKIFADFSSVKFRKENCDVIWPFQKILSRNSLLPILGKFLGLDIYIQATK